MDNQPHDTLSFLQRLQEYGLIGYVWVIIIGAWAGSVRYLTNLNGGKFSWKEMFIEMFTSGFVGLIVGLLCWHYEVGVALTGALAGISAHYGTRTLYIITDILKKKLQISTSDCDSCDIGPKQKFASKKKRK